MACLFIKWFIYVESALVLLCDCNKEWKKVILKMIFPSKKTGESGLQFSCWCLKDGRCPISRILSGSAVGWVASSLWWGADARLNLLPWRAECPSLDSASVSHRISLLNSIVLLLCFVVLRYAIIDDTEVIWIEFSDWASGSGAGRGCKVLGPSSGTSIWGS